MVQAAMLGDRSLLLPKGRTVDCSLSTRVVSDLAGMATCVLTSNVYSDNGRVVLLERGSEAVGEYGAVVAQGQRRLFVLWTRVKTPSGVVINLNSPAADALGTSGLEGYVDNHWWERIGAAFMLSLVQDAIAYKTAEATGGGGAQGTAVFQNSSQTGDRLAEKVLDSTINIKPTIYKNQGDRATIFVARDLDFGTVYALRAR
jgi:type IV secretion system protein VirB10